MVWASAHSDLITDKIYSMKKRIMGIILSILGIAGLVAAFLMVTGFRDSDHVGELLACGILAAAAFFVGIRLVPDGSGSVKEKEVGV
jgi:hypothetical protein